MSQSPVWTLVRASSARTWFAHNGVPICSNSASAVTRVLEGGQLLSTPALQLAEEEHGAGALEPHRRAVVLGQRPLASLDRRRRHRPWRPATSRGSGRPQPASTADRAVRRCVQALDEGLGVVEPVERRSSPPRRWGWYQPHDLGAGDDAEAGRQRLERGQAAVVLAQGHLQGIPLPSMAIRPSGASQASAALSAASASASASASRPAWASTDARMDSAMTLTAPLPSCSARSTASLAK